MDEWDEDTKREEALVDVAGDTMVWQVVNEDGSGVVTDEIFNTREDALDFIAGYCEATGDVPATLVPEEISLAYDVEFGRLPEDVRNEVESRLEDARKVWADEAVSALEFTLGDEGV